MVNPNFSDTRPRSRFVGLLVYSCICWAFNIVCILWYWISVLRMVREEQQKRLKDLELQNRSTVSDGRVRECKLIMGQHPGSKLLLARKDLRGGGILFGCGKQEVGAAVDKLPVATNLTRDGECLVCLDKLNAGGRCVQLPCGHFYHRNCIKEWFLSRNVETYPCPVCQFQFEYYLSFQLKYDVPVSKLVLDKE